MKNSVKDTHCNGTPKGGLCIAIPSHLCENIKENDRKPSIVSEKSPKMFLKSKSQESNVKKENISIRKNKKFVAGQNSSDLDTNEIVQEIIPENAQKKDEILGENGNFFKKNK